MIRTCIALMCAVSVMANAQETVTLAAGTTVSVSTVSALVPSKLQVGDAVDLKLVHALRAGTRVVAPKGTVVHGHVVSVALKPVAVEVAVDPLTVQDVPVVMSGNPLESKKGKLVQVDDPSPKELDWHFRLTAGQAAEVAGVGLVALPFVALASPFLLYEGLKSDAMRADKPIEPGHRAVLKTAAAVTIPADGLVEEKTVFAGPPVIFFADRMYQKNGRVSCGVDPLLGPKHPKMSVLRVEPRTYTFISDRKEETQAVVDAKADERYLVYHDHAGLHAVGLMGRPDLVERLPEVNGKTVFLFDATTMTAAEKEGAARDVAHGGCGVAKQLHVRESKVEPFKP